MLSDYQLLQERMHLPIQHLLVLGNIAQEGKPLAAAYHWSVLQITYLDNINAAQEDHDMVTRLLEECTAALGLQETTYED